MNLFDIELWQKNLRTLGLIAIVVGVGCLGAVVAVNQNFMGWLKISKGESTLAEPFYLDPFLLSGGSLFIIVAQVCLIGRARSRLTE